MKFVLYLSGKRGASLSFHQTQDSVSGSVTIPKGQEDAFIKMLEAFGYIEDLDPKWTILELDSGVDDLFSDLEDNGISDPFYEVAKACRELINDPTSCGVFHIIRSNRA